MYLQSHFRAPIWFSLSTIEIFITQVSKEASSQELENSAIAAVMGTGDNQSKTWREDPIVE